MKQLGVVFLMLFIFSMAFSQKAELSNYSYVIVPDSFDFLKEPDQYKLNSMTMFYLEKSGFHPFFESNAPNANRCDGLYADVEKLTSILGARVQVVLRDCKGNEVYRSEVGRSKVKDYEVGFQDALRRGFKDLERMGVQQKDLVLLTDSELTSSDSAIFSNSSIEKSKPRTETAHSSEPLLPTSKFSSYSLDGNSYLLRKTADGYYLYEENTNSEDGLKLVGKIITLKNLIKFMDDTGKVFDVIFDSTGNLTIQNDSSSNTYRLVD
ncbi:hypothetical protein EI546_07530 [Aequorivita sp. H23M31]|uniref:Uncharacterized protein n=1 Tax=Aequorivita ciconiae TaxID=2494375 RepID=A0A410G2S6_9FLAO|nr:hypothetical protein [Aequorivita sp. H23M31]QAA81584.1 hypothetical protein EI546_07530 [Aequorivita sp. H23M31]